MWFNDVKRNFWFQRICICQSFLLMCYNFQQQQHEIKSDSTSTPKLRPYCRAANAKNFWSVWIVSFAIENFWSVWIVKLWQQIFTNEMVLVEGRKPFRVIRVVSPLDRSLSIFLITGLNIFIRIVYFEIALKHLFSLLFWKSSNILWCIMVTSSMIKSKLIYRIHIVLDQSQDGQESRGWKPTFGNLLLFSLIWKDWMGLHYAKLSWSTSVNGTYFSTNTLTCNLS